MSKEKTSILISLDSLLDTRLGTVAKIDKDAVSKILLNGNYHNREIDIFDNIDRDLYKKLYLDRDVETLSNSLVTNMILFLRSMVYRLEEEAITTPHHSGAKVVINVYPYVLDDNLCNEIRSAVSAHLSDLVRISFINLSPKELTPLYCKNNFAVMIMYDYGEWLETNAELFLITQIPEITLFIPAIYFINKPSTVELEKLIKESAHPMKALKTLAAGIITLELIDVSFFSIINEKI